MIYFRFNLFIGMFKVKGLLFDINDVFRIIARYLCLRNEHQNNLFQTKQRIVDFQRYLLGKLRNRPFNKIIKSKLQLHCPYHLQFYMGTNSSKIKDFIYVTGQSLDPYQLHHNKVNNPHKQVSIDYKAFGPKKFYKQDAKDEEVDAHLGEIKKKQDILKQFKHYKDFDRTDFIRMREQAVPFQIFAEQSIKITFFAGLGFARLSAVHNFRDFFTIASIFRLFFPILLCTIPLLACRTFTSHQYHIVNHQYFRILTDQISQYVQYDQKFNLYKDVQDQKYKFKYPTRADFYKVRRPVLDNQKHTMKALYKEYYEYENGLKKDPIQEFAQSRAKKRTGNWEILTDEEKKIISKDIQQRTIRQSALTPRMADI